MQLKNQVQNLLTELNKGVLEKEQAISLALWDRCLVRLEVKNVENLQNFNDLLTKPLKSYEDNVKDDLKITNEQFTEIQAAIDDIKVPENAPAAAENARIEAEKAPESF